MSMFCFQCQETAGNSGCTVKGVCGKDQETANLQDVLVYALKGLAGLARRRAGSGEGIAAEAELIMRGLFATITNANFDPERIRSLVFEALQRKAELAASVPRKELTGVDAWQAASVEELEAAFSRASVLAEEDPDARSLKEFIVYGMKGLSAYGDHAGILGFRDEELDRELVDILAAVNDPLSTEELTGLLVRTGEACVRAMALLDRANTSTYGNPEVTRVDIGVRNRPGILVSGHDLKDLEELLEQTRGAGVDVYTHGEMLPAHYYPAFKKYKHLAGNYGGSWWRQGSEFESFNGPILMTTNCIIPVKGTYRGRIFTTGMAGYPGVAHIPDRRDGKPKDFSRIIELARSCPPPRGIENGEIVGGFAHHQVEQLAGKVVDAVKSGAIKKFVVMGGCDGRMKSRQYFTDLAGALPPDTVILTAGCAKYRYNKLPLGEIGGIPRVLDAGQCNDSYSIAAVALKLAEILDVDDINQLPVDFAVAWYEQKAVCVLLALLALGFKGVRIGPTLPAFVSENVKQLIVQTYGLKATADVASDLQAILGNLLVYG
ncbi:MAG: hydroxylamine reductase [Spirochaetota bacterium]